MGVAFEHREEHAVAELAYHGGNVGESGGDAALLLLGGDFGDGTFEEPLDEVDIVTSGVEEGSAGLGVIHDPGALAGRMGAAARDHDGVTDLALRDGIFDDAKGGVEALDEADHQQYAGVGACGGHVVGILGRETHGFVAEDMLTGSGGGYGHLGVEMRG